MSAAPHWQTNCPQTQTASKSRSTHGALGKLTTGTPHPRQNEFGLLSHHPSRGGRSMIPPMLPNGLTGTAYSPVIHTDTPLLMIFTNNRMTLTIDRYRPLIHVDDWYTLMTDTVTHWPSIHDNCTTHCSLCLHCLTLTCHARASPVHKQVNDSPRML